MTETTNRCAAAHAEDTTRCEGARDAVRILDEAGAQVLGCVHHGAVLLASLVGARVYNGPGARTLGDAGEADMQARHLPPFAFERAVDRGEPGTLPPEAVPAVNIIADYLGAQTDAVPASERITNFDQAVRVNAYELARRWGANEWPIRVSLRIAEGTDLPAREVADDLEELAVMAALRMWLDRWTPIQIHDALSAGATVEQAAAAMGVDPTTLADTWREWSAGQRRMWQTYPDMDRTDEHNRVADMLAGYPTPTERPGQ